MDNPQDDFDRLGHGYPPAERLLPQIQLWTSVQVADYLGIARYTLTRRVEAGQTMATRFKGQLYFTRDQIRLAARVQRMTHAEMAAIRDRNLGDPVRFELVGEPTGE